MVVTSSRSQTHRFAAPAIREVRSPGPDEFSAVQPSNQVMSASRPWCRVRFTDRHGSVVGGCLLGGCDDPDLGTVETIARLALVAKRRGGGVVLSEVRDDLARLLDLCGLPVDVQWQPERGE
jgi:hypothetical protein